MIEIRFDMPYALKVDGDFILRTAGKEFQVQLSTHNQENPRFPGAEKVENISIIHDDTNILAYTEVVARYVPSEPSEVADTGYLSGKGVEIALSIANALVAAARLAHGDYILDYIHTSERIGPIHFSVPAIDGRKPFFGTFDPLMGGITFRRRARIGSETAKFAQILAEGSDITTAQELYFDARRYFVRGNLRMALANLVISFEVGLADSLSRVAASRKNVALEAQIIEATLGELGTGLAKQVFGHSLEEQSFWGAAVCDGYVWLRRARNGILHKARTLVERGGVKRDFGDRGELERLFGERDLIVAEVEKAVSRAI